MAVHNLTWALN